MLARLKFDISTLADQMLDAFPEEMFASKDTLFLDPIMGGGQFVHSIEERLRRYGHSDENISGRVFGFESNQMRVNYAVNSNNLVGEYNACSVKDYVENNLKGFSSMKFDAIVGNPPFDGVYKGLGTPWPKISSRSLELLKDGGHIYFITPASWMSPSSDLRKEFLCNNLVSVNTNIAEYFKGVGSSFTAWHVVKEPYKGVTTFETEAGDTEIDISKFDFLPNTINPVVFSTVDKVLNTNDVIDVHISSKFHTQHGNFKEKSSKKYSYPARHTNTSTLYFSEPHPNHKVKKVTFCMTGSLQPRYDAGTMGTCQNTMWIEVKNAKEGKNVISFMTESKIMKFICDVCKWSGANNRYIFKILPNIDFETCSTDESIYKALKLTKKEIEHIESNY